MKVDCVHRELVSITELLPHPKNRNRHSLEQVERLAKLIDHHGFRRAIIVSNLSGFIVAGHGTLEAAKTLGYDKVPVDYQDFDSDEAEYAFMVSDNAIAAWAELDLAGINSDIGDLGPDFDIDMLGIRDFTVDVAEKHEGDPDAVPETPKEAKTSRGELWTLGEHRVLCGDATSREDIERLMAGEKADMVFTDPPYGIGYEYASHDDSSSEENEQLVATALLAQDCGKVWTPGLMNLARDVSRFGKAKIAVWYKKFAQAGSGLGGASTWEPILILNPTARTLPNDVLVVPTEREYLNGESLRELHSCPKPVNLYEQLLSGLSNRADRIFEPFCGSGTTLIACQKTSRRCFGMEIEPLYVDVILTRWAKFTGKDPVREDGKRWSELNA